MELSLFWFFCVLKMLWCGIDRAWATARNGTNSVARCKRIDLLMRFCDTIWIPIGYLSFIWFFFLILMSRLVGVCVASADWLRNCLNIGCQLISDWNDVIERLVIEPPQTCANQNSTVKWTLEQWRRISNTVCIHRVPFVIRFCAYCCCCCIRKI